MTTEFNIRYQVDIPELDDLAGGLNDLEEKVLELDARVASLEHEPPPPPPPPPPPIDPSGYEAGINMTIGGYPKSSGYPFSSRPPDLSRSLIENMVNSWNITHVRGNYFIEHESDPTVVMDDILSILNGGCTITVANHSWCSGQDPSHFSEVTEAFRKIVRSFPTDVTEGRLRIEPWNEPGGQWNVGTYSGGPGASVMHSKAWISWHRTVMDSLLLENLNLGFDVNDTHGGGGGRVPENSCIAAYGAELMELTTDDVRGDIHFYQQWPPGTWAEFTSMVGYWPMPIVIGEFGGSNNYAERGKTENHHSNIAYPPAVMLMDNAPTLPDYVQSISIWHAYQAWESGFTLSAEHDLPNRPNPSRFAPWDIDGHTMTEIGSKFLEHAWAVRP